VAPAAHQRYLAEDDDVHVKGADVISTAAARNRWRCLRFIAGSVVAALSFSARASVGTTVRRFCEMPDVSKASTKSRAVPDRASIWACRSGRQCSRSIGSVQNTGQVISI
jgi:hypothetical protein